MKSPQSRDPRKSLPRRGLQWHECNPANKRERCCADSPFLLIWVLRGEDKREEGGRTGTCRYFCTTLRDSIFRGGTSTYDIHTHTYTLHIRLVPHAYLEQTDAGWGRGTFPFLFCLPSFFSYLLLAFCSQPILFAGLRFAFKHAVYLIYAGQTGT